MSAEYEEVRSSAQGGSVTLLDEDLTRVLGGFGLQFDNHDHPIGWISAGGVTYSSDGYDPRTFLLALSDSDSNDALGTGDPCTLWAKLHCLTLRPIRVVRGESLSNGTGTASVTVPSDEHFLLRGFSFKLTRNTNHNIRRICVHFNRSRSQVEVVMRDNSPSDDSYHFEVIYATIQMDHPFYTGPYREDFTFTQQTAVPMRKRGQAILAGFDFEFTDNDHHLREISVDPVADDHFIVRFTDDERDNPVRASLEYMVYAPFVY